MRRFLFMKKFTSLLSGLLLLWAGVCPLEAQTFRLGNQPQKKATVSVPLNAEGTSLSATQAAERFYQDRAQQLLTTAAGNNLTYSQKYDYIVGSVYPPTFWQDKIKGVAPYDTEGILFTFAMRETYESLKQAKPLDIPAAVDKTLTYLVLNTRDVDVAKISPFYQKKGDPWFTAFALMGQYDQLGQFTQKYKDLQGLYKEYKGYQAAKNWDMVTYYNTHYDFTPLEQKMDVKVFRARQEDIKGFARGLSNGIYTFLSRVLVPLQTEAVPDGDVLAYLDEHLSSAYERQALPDGLDMDQLKAVILKTIPSDEEIDRETQEERNTLVKPLKTVKKALKKGSGVSLWGVLSIFEYLAPSTYLRVLDGMSFEEQKEIVAAAHLNKRLAQIANDLFEMERIFAFPTANVEGDTIYPNWHKLATNDTFSQTIIARLAADNIMKSGRGKYQTNALADMQLKGRKMEAAKVNKEVMLFAIDFLPIGGLGELGKTGEAVAQAGKTSQKTATISGKAARMAARAEKESSLLTKRGLQALKIDGKTAKTTAKGQQLLDAEKGVQAVAKGTGKGTAKEVALSGKTKVVTQQSGVPYSAQKPMTYAEARDLIRARAEATPAGQPVDLSDLRMTDDIMSRVSETPSAISPAKLESSVTGPLKGAVGEAKAAAAKAAAEKGELVPLGKMDRKSAWEALVPQSREGLPLLHNGASTFTEEVRIHKGLTDRLLNTQRDMRASAEKLADALEGIRAPKGYELDAAAYRQRMAPVVENLRSLGKDSKLSDDLTDIQNLVERVASRDVPLAEKQALYQQISQKYDDVYSTLATYRQNVRNAQSWANRSRGAINERALKDVDESLAHIEGILMEDTQKIEGISKQNLSVIDQHIKGIDAKAARKAAAAENKSAKARKKAEQKLQSDLKKLEEEQLKKMQELSRRQEKELAARQAAEKEKQLLKAKQAEEARQAEQASVLRRTEKAPKGPFKNVTSAKRVSGADDRARAVWSLSDDSGNVVGYYKIGTKNEVDRAEIVRGIMDGKQGLRAKHTGIEVEYPRVLTNDTELVPTAVYDKITKDARGLEYQVRSAGQRMQTGFISSPVDASGMTLADLKYKKIEFEAISRFSKNGLTVEEQVTQEMLRQLGGKPLSYKEWEQVTDFVTDLNEAGFEHGDMLHNLFIKRNPSTGKIKLTLLDFEEGPAGLLSDQQVLDKWKERLEFYGGLR